MASSVDYHDDRSNFTHDDAGSHSHGYHMTSGNSSTAAAAASAILAEPYPYMSPSPSGYADQSYYVNSQPAGSATDHERELNLNHNLSDPSLNDGTGGEYTMVPRHVAGPGSDYGEEESRTMLPDESEPQAEPDNYVEDVVQPGFDEAILRALCDMDVGIPLLLDRIKQSITSCREASVFLKKRAALEEEYGRGLQKLARQTSEVYAMSDGKAGTFVAAWHSSMKIHEIIGDNRIKFASKLNEMSDDLNMLAKEVDKNRKGTKDLSTRYERALQESEQALEKAKNRHDVTADELQRFLLFKEGESSKDAGMPTSSNTRTNKRVIGKAMTKGGMLLKGKNPANLQRQEEDVRARMSSAAEAFRKAVQETQTMRQEYFNFQLPRFLRALKECADEIDLGLQYHLSRYAYLLENTALQDGSSITPGGIEDGPGIKVVISSIDNQQDFKVYMQNYAVSHAPKGPRREGPWEEGFLPPIPNHTAPQERVLEPQSSVTSPTSTQKPQGSITPSTPERTSIEQQLQMQTPARTSESRPSRGNGPTFGIHLADQMHRDNVEVPRIVEKCCAAIRDSGALDSVGIYRISGITSKVQRLKTAFDKDVDAVDLSAQEWASDINTVTSTLKLWLRELPEPLLTFSLYNGFIDAAKIENDRLRHIRLHERVNDLPDPNYATLKYLLGHLHEVTERSHLNQMHASNLSIVFGPTLLGPPPNSRSASINARGDGSAEGSSTLADMNLQCKAIETILEHYQDIFVDEEENA